MFEVGDTVRLKSGNTEQRVVKVRPDNTIDTTYSKSSYRLFGRKASDFVLVDTVRTQPEKVYHRWPDGVVRLSLGTDQDGRVVARGEKPNTFLTEGSGVLTKVVPTTYRIRSCGDTQYSKLVNIFSRVIINEKLMIRGRLYYILKKEKYSEKAPTLPANTCRVAAEAIV